MDPPGQTYSIIHVWDAFCGDGNNKAYLYADHSWRIEIDTCSSLWWSVMIMMIILPLLIGHFRPQVKYRASMSDGNSISGFWSASYCAYRTSGMWNAHGLRSCMGLIYLPRSKSKRPLLLCCAVISAETSKLVIQARCRIKLIPTSLLLEYHVTKAPHA